MSEFLENIKYNLIIRNIHNSKACRFEVLTVCFIRFIQPVHSPLVCRAFFYYITGGESPLALSLAHPGTVFGHPMKVPFYWK